MNGVYAYGGPGSFPTRSWNSSNYWVDVVMDARNRAPTAGADSGFSIATGTPLVIPFAALLANDSDPDGDALTLSGVSGATNGTVAFDTLAQTVTFTPTSGYSGTAGFTYGIFGNTPVDQMYRKNNPLDAPSLQAKRAVSHTIEAVEGRSSAANPTRSLFSGSSAPSGPRRSYL